MVAPSCENVTTLFCFTRSSYSFIKSGLAVKGGPDSLTREGFALGGAAASDILTIINHSNPLIFQFFYKNYAFSKVSC